MGFVWLIRLHLNRTVKFLSCEKASKVSPQSTGETGGVEVSCVCSALAQVQLHVPGAPAVPEPARSQAWHCLAQKGPGREQDGPDLSLHKTSLCVLAPSLGAAG